MKKGKTRIIIGSVLIFLQLLSVLGNTKTGISISLSFENFNVFLYGLMFLLGYLWIGVIGAILLISGLIAYYKKPKEKTDDKLINLFADAFADAAKISREKGPILLKGQRPNESDYGYSASNPICSSTLAGTDVYLGKLRTPDGKKFTWQRIGDVRADCNGVTDVGMDKYQLYLDNKPYKILYIVPYVANATYAPYGLVLLDESSGESSTVCTPINNPVEDVQKTQDIDSTNTSSVNATAETEKTQSNKPQRYCTFCGNIIDNTTKKCTNCGKSSNNKTLIIVLVVLLILIVLFVMFNFKRLTEQPSNSSVISNSDNSTTANSNINSTSSNVNSYNSSKKHQHSYSKTVKKSATCKKEGLLEFTCECGDAYTEAIIKGKHSYSNATCTKPKTCSVCGATQGSALNHSVINGVCSKCSSIILTETDLQGTWKSTWNNTDSYRKISFSGNSFYEENYIEMPDYGYTDFITFTGTFSVKGNVLTIRATATNTRTTESGSETSTYAYNYDDIITKYTPSLLCIEGLQPFYKQ